MRNRISLFIVATMLVSFCGCASRTQEGAIIGAASGAVVGGVIGNAAGNTAVGAIVGAAVGGAAGAWIGSYMDKQAAEIERDLAGARVERIGEGIKITFDSGILFDTDRSALKPVAVDNIGKLAVILNKYPDTNILIEGHTDSQGSEDYNLELSRRRAQSVANQLGSDQVIPTRFTLMGYGEGQPVASNDTPEGRQLNRRVEIAIYANDKLKKIAAEKAGG